jgi:hypothetical protein
MPGGTHQCREHSVGELFPALKRRAIFSRPSGTWVALPLHPAWKRWATFDRPPGWVLLIMDVPRFPPQIPVPQSLPTVCRERRK